MDPAVRVNGLTKRYGDRVAVADISFEVAEGEIFGLLGPNGSGKTTTVECLQGLRKPDSGELAVFGRNPRTETVKVRHMVGSQLQDSALPDRLRVWEALRLFSAVSPDAQPWEALIEEWGLGSQRRTAFGDLSGGQKQRLFVALALVANPRLVVLDEMTTGLDPLARRLAWDLIEAVRDRGTTVILVTHFMDEAERLCDRVAVLSAGVVVAEGAVSGLMKSLGDSSTVKFTTGSDVRFLTGVEGVESVRAGRSGAVSVDGSGPLLARVAHALVERGIEPFDLRVEMPTLEDVYLSVTGEAPGEGMGQR